MRLALDLHHTPSSLTGRELLSWELMFSAAQRGRESISDTLIWRESLVICDTRFTFLLDQDFSEKQIEFIYFFDEKYQALLLIKKKIFMT